MIKFIATGMMLTMFVLYGFGLANILNTKASINELGSADYLFLLIGLVFTITWLLNVGKEKATKGN